MQKKTTRILRNPTTSDFVVTKARENGGNHVYLIRALETQEYDEPLASWIKKHLANHVLNTRPLIGGNSELTLKKINEEIEIEI